MGHTVNQVYNKIFAANNEIFRKACELSGVEPTKRQASKYRREKGKAFLLKDKAKEELKSKDNK